jgi:hypothetical protein
VRGFCRGVRLSALLLFGGIVKLEGTYCLLLAF